MYGYDDLSADMRRAARFAEVGSIGTSLLGKELYFVHLGPKKSPQIIITGGIHARENVTCLLVMRQAFALESSSMGFYFLPMINPDGAMLLKFGASAAGEYARFATEVNGGDDFSQWKANVRAVDLNLNFDAKFGRGKGNLRTPAPQGYIGTAPLSEPETRALADLTLKVRPVYTLSYHALGREVYWEFGQTDRRDRRAARLIADELGYKLVDGDLGSAGGYKDWCVENGIPGVTIEIGREGLRHPLTEADVAEDIERNLHLPSKLPSILRNVYGEL